jgi:hypothetical protein
MYSTLYVGGREIKHVKEGKNPACYCTVQIGIISPGYRLLICTPFYYTGEISSIKELRNIEQFLERKICSRIIREKYLECYRNKKNIESFIEKLKYLAYFE